VVTGCAAPAGRHPERRFAAEIDAFVAADRLAPPASGGVLFVGSSSIRMWSTLEADFPGIAVLNRGFGGSELEDVVRAAPRIVVPCAPRLIIVYAGDNDLANGKSPERVCGDFVRLRQLLQTALPATHLAFIAIKPSPARWHLASSVRQANDCIRQQMADDSRLVFVDVFTPMLGGTGTPRPELFLDDGLHLNAAGYALWRQVLAPIVLTTVP